MTVLSSLPAATYPVGNYGPLSGSINGFVLAIVKMTGRSTWPASAVAVITYQRSRDGGATWGEDGVVTITGGGSLYKDDTAGVRFDFAGGVPCTHVRATVSISGAPITTAITIEAF